MSEQPLGPQHDRLGSAIDQTVRRLVRRDPPADLRARVLDRLSQPARARWAWTPRRLALAGAAVAVASAVVLVVPRWRERTTTPRLESQAAAGIPAQPSVAPVRPPEPGPQIARPLEAARQAPPRRRGAARAVEVAAVTARAEDLLVIDPLPVPNPITIGPLESERVTPLRLDITPLQFETVQIEPIQVPR